jgi:hypothetical protein
MRSFLTGFRAHGKNTYTQVSSWPPIKKLPSNVGFSE